MNLQRERVCVCVCFNCFRGKLELKCIVLLPYKRSHLLVELVEGVGDPLDDGDTELLAEGRDVLVSDSAVRLGIFLEGEGRRTPFSEEFWQGVRRLASDHEEPRVQLV